MARTRKPTPLEAFELNMADADLLVSFAIGLSNQRVRRARSELRDRVGEALRINKRDRLSIDCIESDDAFVVIKPRSTWSRKDLEDVRPLLRQALVAGCAATETYLGDAAIAVLGQMTAGDGPLPPRLGRVQLTVEQWLEIERRYKRKRWGLHQIIAEHIREECSTSPTKFGNVLSMIGVKNWAQKVDTKRRVSAGSTVDTLTRITLRRNKIAHEGDRKGQGRAGIEIADVRNDLSSLRGIVAATEEII